MQVLCIVHKACTIHYNSYSFLAFQDQFCTVFLNKKIKQDVFKWVVTNVIFFIGK